MLEFIKMFGLGILYTILFPFIVAIFALYLVYVFFNYLVMELISFFGFFFGYTFTVETELERQLAKMKEASETENVLSQQDTYSYEETGVEQEIQYEKGSDEQ